MRRLAEDDLVQLLCSYLSVVESSLNRYGTKVVRGGVSERAVERTDRRPHTRFRTFQDFPKDLPPFGGKLIVR